MRSGEIRDIKFVSSAVLSNNIDELIDASCYDQLDDRQRSEAACTRHMVK